MKDTIKNIFAHAMELLKKFTDGITKNHSGKMEGMWSFSTSCHENKYCEAYSKDENSICHSCYANKLLNCRKTLDNKVKRNGDFIKLEIFPVEALPVIPFPFFRWEAFGDIETVQQAVNYINITANNPHVKFAWFTKNPFLIDMAFKLYNLEKPENLTIIGSSRYVNKPDTSLEKYWFIDHIFTVYEKEYAEKHNIPIHCGGLQCLSCLKCYDKERKAPFYINELKK